MRQPVWEHTKKTKRILMWLMNERHTRYEHIKWAEWGAQISIQKSWYLCSVTMCPNFPFQANRITLISFMSFGCLLLSVGRFHIFKNSYHTKLAHFSYRHFQCKSITLNWVLFHSFWNDATNQRSHLFHFRLFLSLSSI